MSVALIPCLPPGVHPGMDALAHGLADELAAAGLSLRVAPTDLRQPDMARQQAGAIDAAVAQQAEAVVLFVVNRTAAAEAVQRAIAAGVPIIAIHRPRFVVSACILVPNYDHGLITADHLARSVGPNSRVAVVGGPDILDDIEMVEGAVAGIRRAELRLLNDPFEPRYRNLDDVAGAGAAAAEAVFADHWPFDGLIVFNDETLRDTLPVIDRYAPDSELPVFSRNGSPDVVEWARQGRATGTFDYALPEIGREAGRAVIACLEDRTMSDVLRPAPVGRMITRATAAEYVPWSMRAAPRELPLMEVATC